MAKGIKKYFISCIKKVSSSSSVNGREIITWCDTPINGYIGSRSTTDITVAESDIHEIKYNFYCDDVTIKYGDRVLYLNKMYEIINDPQNTINKNHHFKCIVKFLPNIKQ